MYMRSLMALQTQSLLPPSSPSTLRPPCGVHAFMLPTFPKLACSPVAVLPALPCQREGFPANLAWPWKTVTSNENPHSRRMYSGYVMLSKGAGRSACPCRALRVDSPLLCSVAFSMPLIPGGAAAPRRRHLPHFVMALCGERGGRVAQLSGSSASSRRNGELQFRNRSKWLDCMHLQYCSACRLELTRSQPHIGRQYVCGIPCCIRCHVPQLWGAFSGGCEQQSHQ